MGGRLTWRRLLLGVVLVAAVGGLPACSHGRFVGPVPGPDFLIIGHRGAPNQACENTLESFVQALRLGANALELDVSMTHDGHLVLWHDWVDRVRDRVIHRLRPTGLCDVVRPLLYRPVDAVASITASATPFCFCTTQKHLTVKRAMSSRA